MTAASTVAYLVAYNTALAALGWVVVVEALPLPYRAFGAGVAVGTRWLGAFAVAMSFRWLNTCAHRGPRALSGDATDLRRIRLHHASKPHSTTTTRARVSAPVTPQARLTRGQNRTVLQGYDYGSSSTKIPRYKIGAFHRFEYKE